MAYKMGIIDSIKRNDEPYYTAYIIENKERIKILHAPAGSKTFVWKRQSGKGGKTSASSLRTSPGDEVYTVDPTAYLYRSGLNTIFVYEHGNVATPITSNVPDPSQKMPTPEDLYNVAEDTLVKNAVRGIEKMESMDIGKVMTVVVFGLLAIGILYYFMTV